jgi:hypothetical protein
MMKMKKVMNTMESTKSISTKVSKITIPTQLNPMKIVVQIPNANNVKLKTFTRKMGNGNAMMERNSASHFKIHRGVHPARKDTLVVLPAHLTNALHVKTVLFCLMEVAGNCGTDHLNKSLQKTNDMNTQSINIFFI